MEKAQLGLAHSYSLVGAKKKKKKQNSDNVEVRFVFTWRT
jgi:hypothetical protein